MSRISILSCALLLSGCQATGQLYTSNQLPEGSGEVVVYRPSNRVNIAGYPNLYVNDKKISGLMNGGYKSITLAPGQYAFELSNFWSWDGKQQWQATVQAGQKQYFKVESRLNSAHAVGNMVYVSKTISITSVPESVAAIELREMKESAN